MIFEALFTLVAILFLVKIVFNLSVPYSLQSNIYRSGERGISLMPGLELMLLALAIFLSFGVPRYFDLLTPANVALAGGGVVLISYLHFVVACALAGWITQRKSKR